MEGFPLFDFFQYVCYLHSRSAKQQFTYLETVSLLYIRFR